MKKLLSLILAVVMLMGMTVSAFAETDTVSFGVTSAKGKVGDTVTVDVTISENHYMVNGQIKLYYDDSALELVPVNDTTVAELNSDILGTKNMAYVVSPMKGRVNFAYVSMESKGKATGGTIFSLTFKILDAAQAENVITIKVPEFNTNATGAETDTYPEAVLTNGVITKTAYAKGDVNLDGTVDIADATHLFRAVNGRVVLTDEQRAVAMLNDDDIVDISDATKLFRFVNGRIATLD